MDPRRRTSAAFGVDSPATQDLPVDPRCRASTAFGRESPPNLPVDHKRRASTAFGESSTLTQDQPVDPRRRASEALGVESPPNLPVDHERRAATVSGVSSPSTEHQPGDPRRRVSTAFGVSSPETQNLAVDPRRRASTAFEVVSPPTQNLPALSPATTNMPQTTVSSSALSNGLTDLVESIQKSTQNGQRFKEAEAKAKSNTKALSRFTRQIPTFRSTKRLSMQNANLKAQKLQALTKYTETSKTRVNAINDLSQILQAAPANHESNAITKEDLITLQSQFISKNEFNEVKASNEYLTNQLTEIQNQITSLVNMCNSIKDSTTSQAIPDVSEYAKGSEISGRLDEMTMVNAVLEARLVHFKDEIDGISGDTRGLQDAQTIQKRQLDGFSNTTFTSEMATKVSEIAEKVVDQDLGIVRKNLEECVSDVRKDIQTHGNELSGLKNCKCILSFSHPCHFSKSFA